MKALSLSALLVLAVSGASAQKFEIGAGGGFIRNSIHNYYSGATYGSYEQFQTSVTSPLLSVKGMYNTKHYQFGVALESRTLKYKGVNYPDGPYILIAYAPTEYTERQTPVKVFVNRVARFKHMEAYGGVSAGYIFSNVSSKVGTPNPWDGQIKVDNGRATGDVHVGASYFITKHFGVNAEVAGEFTAYPKGPLEKNVLVVPVTVGLRYKL